jgi:hypothetical protein
MPKIVANIPPLVYRKLIWKKDNDGYGDKSWEEWLSFLGRTVNFELTLGEQIQEVTSKSMYQLWMANLAENLDVVRYGQDVKVIKPKKPQPHTILEFANPEPTRENPPQHTAIVVGAGPSVFRRNHVKQLADSSYKGYIIATDKMLVPLLEAGIVPTVTVTVDGSPIISKFYDHPLVKRYGSQIKIAAAITINPKVVQVIIQNKCIIHWFGPMFDEWTAEDSVSKFINFLTRTEYNEKGAPITQAGGNCGSTAWILSWELFKASPVALIGFDMGYPLDTNLDETPYYSTVMTQTSNAAQRVGAISGSYQQVYNPYFDTWAKMDAVFCAYRKSLLSMVKGTKPWVLNKTYNCTEGGTLFGKGIKCIPFKDFLERYKK